MGMPIEVRDRWVAALRSGQYEQGKQKFERDGKFCCLGVLCDVMGQPATNRGGDGQWAFVRGLLDGYNPHELATRNDDGMPFAEIADYIEQNVPVS